jgi:carbonic anhydrase
VQDAWQCGQALSLHGWIYRLHDGLVTDLGMEAECLATLESCCAETTARLTTN